MEAAERREWLKASQSVAYFLDRYAQVFNPQGRAWVPFRLWPEQVRVADVLQAERQVVVLKARQLGMSWLCLGFGLWLMVFRPAATVLLFSRRDDEAIDLLDFRLKGMYERLPGWMQAREVVESSAHGWKLSSGSMAYAFPTTGGDSYTASLVIVDEADLIPNLSNLLGRVEPTISAGGRIVLLSRADKGQPASTFKRLYLAAKAGESPYRAVFLPWSARPERTAAWYEEQRRNILAADGSLDRLHEQYPASDGEALAARSLDKRVPGEWLIRCDRTNVSRETFVLNSSAPGLVVFRRPTGLVVAGVDPAEGNPHSDESAAVWVEVETGEMVAVLAGRFEPGAMAGYVDEVSVALGAEQVLVERNNHGHAVLAWLLEHGRVSVLRGRDGKPGFLTNAIGKVELWRHAAEVVRDEAPGIADTATLGQIASIEGGSLRAPVGLHDDRAMAWALAQWARLSGGGGEGATVAAVDPLQDLGDVY